MAATIDLGLVRGGPGTAHIKDDVLSDERTIATNNGALYVAPNKDPSDKTYFAMHGDSFGVCPTGREINEKMVDLPGFHLVAGTRVSVRFTDTGSENPAGGELTLNVDSTGAKPIVRGDADKEVFTGEDAGEFFNNMVKEFVYDGECWVCVSPLNGEAPDILDSVEAVKNNTQPGQLAGALALKEVIARGGVWLGTRTVEAGSASVVIEDESITEASIIDVYYAEAGKAVLADAVPSYSQEAGRLTISFANELSDAVTITNVKVVDP